MATSLKDNAFSGSWSSEITETTKKTKCTVTTRIDGNRIVSIMIGIDFSGENPNDGSAYTYTLANRKAVHDAIRDALRDKLGTNF